MHKTLLAVIIALLPFAAHSQTKCTTVDLRSSLGEARDQGESGWCFANTAADLVSHAVGYRVSGIGSRHGLKLSFELIQ